MLTCIQAITGESMSKQIPKEFIKYQTERASGDSYSHLPLSPNPISVRLPEGVDDWVRLKGTAWLRNLLCDLYFLDDVE